MKKHPNQVHVHHEGSVVAGPRKRVATPLARLLDKLLSAVFALLACALFAVAQTPEPRSPEVRDHLRKAFEYLRAKDSVRASEEFEAVLAMDPKNAEAYSNLGAIALSRRDYSNASQYLRSALEIDPAPAKTRALLGICESRMGQRSAQVLLEKSFATLKDKELQIQVGIELANLYNRQGNTERTASVMQSLVSLDPDNVEILFMAQQVYGELADDTMNKLAVLAPGSARMQQVIAERLINAGDLHAAIEHYKRALEMDPRLPGVRYELGEAILESSPTDGATQAEALKELDAALRNEGDSAKIECQLGRIAFLRSDTQEASAHYNKALGLNPMDVEAQMGLAKILIAADKLQEAAKYLRIAVQSDPLNAEAHYRLSTVCRKLQQTEEADKELRLFQEIKQIKERVRELYRQMNKKPRPQDEQIFEEPRPETKP